MVGTEPKAASWSRGTCQEQWDSCSHILPTRLVPSGAEIGNGLVTEKGEGQVRTLHSPASSYFLP